MRPVIINSVPKSGTNLVGKLVQLLLGPGVSPLHLRPTGAAGGGAAGAAGDEEIPTRVGLPGVFAKHTLRSTLQQQSAERYFTIHVEYSDRMSGLLQELDARMILVRRDPRDVVVSHALYVASSPYHYLYPYYRGLSPEDRITASITGLAESPEHGLQFANISERFQTIIPWRLAPIACMTAFEDLVGAPGGGSRERQLAEVRRIIRHLGLSHSAEEAEAIADRLHSPTATLRKGVIGDWRNHFTAANKQKFKEIAGDTLIALGYERSSDW